MYRNVKMHKPLKGIYVKSNPGDTGTGLVKNVTYENFHMEYPIWWGIYIGPQQMKQPGGEGPGCMIYPLQPCQTNPLVTFEDITVRNLTSYGSVLFAGVIRCNATNPCKNFVFEDVHLTSPFWDLLGIGYISQYIEGVESNDFPDPEFKPEGYYSSHPQSEEDEFRQFNPLKIAMNVITAPQEKWTAFFAWLKDPVIFDTLLGLLFGDKKMRKI